MSLQPLALRFSVALAVAAVAFVAGGRPLVPHAVLWYAGFLLNLRLMAEMARGTATQPALALAWGVKLPVTVGLVAAFLPWSTPLAMVLGLTGAVHAMIAAGLLETRAPVPPRAPVPLSVEES